MSSSTIAPKPPRTFRKRSGVRIEALTPSPSSRIVDGVLELLVDDASVRISPEGYVEVRVDEYGSWLDPGLLVGVGDVLLLDASVEPSRLSVNVGSGISLRSEVRSGIFVEAGSGDAIGFEVYVR